jgi:hypothetical protein
MGGVFDFHEKQLIYLLPFNNSIAHPPGGSRADMKRLIEGNGMHNNKYV